MHTVTDLIGIARSLKAKHGVTKLKPAGKNFILWPFCLMHCSLLFIPDLDYHGIFSLSLSLFNFSSLFLPFFLSSLFLQHRWEVFIKFDLTVCLLSPIWPCSGILRLPCKWGLLWHICLLLKMGVCSSYSLFAVIPKSILLHYYLWGKIIYSIF